MLVKTWEETTVFFREPKVDSAHLTRSADDNVTGSDAARWLCYYIVPGSEIGDYGCPVAVRDGS